MTTDPTTPDRLTALLIAQRANLAWAMIALGVVSAGLGVFCVSKLTSGSAIAKKDDDADKDAEPLTPPTPYRTEYLIGATGGLLGAVVGFGVGLSIIAAARKSTTATLPTDARVATLLAGGAAGLVLVVVGLAYFLNWSPLLARWLDEKVAPPGAWKVITALLVFLVGCGLAFLAAQPARAEERNAQTLRRLVYGLNFALGVLLLVVVLVAGNAFAALKVPAKLDTTESGFYTLSDATKGYLTNLPEPVTIYTTIPDSGERELSDARNLVAAAQAVNPQKVTVRYLSGQLNRNEIAQLQTKYPSADLGGNNYGILITAGDDGKRSAYIKLEDMFTQEAGPMGRGGSLSFSGESKFVQELLTVTETTAKPVVYFTQGSGELSVGGGPDDAGDPRRQATRLKTILEKGYATVRPLAFGAGESKVPDDATVVVVADPTQPMPEKQAAAIRDFMAGGPKGDGKKGKLVVLAGPHVGADGKMAATGLEEVLAGLGVKLGSEFLYHQPIAQLDATTFLAAPATAPVRSRNSLALAIYDYGRPLLIEGARVVDAPRSPAAGPTAAEPLLLTTPRGLLTWLEPTRTDPVAFLQGLEKLSDQDYRDTMVRKQASQSPRPLAAVVSEGTTPRAVVIGAGEFFADQPGREGTGGLPTEVFAAALNWLRDRPAVANVANKTYGTYTLSRDAETVPLFWLPVGVTLTGVLAAGLGVWLLRRM